ncbi:hypothetical protein KSP40_PGU013089 [Platanthera guangdongensis]|uniref:Uncharacterized protein n=1 Tax=Platanthera guangdongensis TaxID=2320717 RepID=A0ABR2LQF2_9ASPA
MLPAYHCQYYHEQPISPLPPPNFHSAEQAAAAWQPLSAPQFPAGFTSHFAGCQPLYSSPSLTVARLPSATKEARKNRVARHRKLSSLHHNRGPTTSAAAAERAELRSRCCDLRRQQLFCSIKYQILSSLVIFANCIPVAAGGRGESSKACVAGCKKTAGAKVGAELEVLAAESAEANTTTNSLSPHCRRQISIQPSRRLPPGNPCRHRSSQRGSPLTSPAVSRYILRRRSPSPGYRRRPKRLERTGWRGIENYLLFTTTGAQQPQPQPQNEQSSDPAAVICDGSSSSAPSNIKSCRHWSSSPTVFPSPPAAEENLQRHALPAAKKRRGPKSEQNLKFLLQKRSRNKEQVSKDQVASQFCKLKFEDLLLKFRRKKAG